MRPPNKIFRPAPPDSPSTSLVGLEQAIPPGRSFPGNSERPSNLDKPLPELPREPPTPESHRRGAVEGGDRFPCQKDERLSREASRRERDEYNEWWNQQNSRYTEAPVSPEATIRERNSQSVSLRGFLSDPSEVDRYMDTTPLKANPYIQEQKRAATFPKPKDLPGFQNVATNGLSRWRNQATGPGFLAGDGMSQRSLVPAPLNLSSEQMASVDALSRFSSSDSEAVVSRSPSIRDSVLSYVRKMSLRKHSSRKKGKLPATTLSSVESVDFPEGRIPPHYTGEYDIQPKVSTPIIQQGVADLEKQMRERSMSCGSDTSDCHREFKYDRFSSDGGCKYGNQGGEGSGRSEGCRSSGSRQRRGQQLAVPTSPYQKYGPKIWDPSGIEKIRRKESSEENKKGWIEGVGCRAGLKMIKFGIIGQAFKSRSCPNTKIAKPRSWEGEPEPVGSKSSSLPRFSCYNRTQSQHQIRSQDRSGGQLTYLSQYVEAFYWGTDEVTGYYETAKKKLGAMRKEERRRKNLKQSIIVLKPVDCSVGRTQSEQWV